MAQDNLFNAADLLAVHINTPVTIDVNGGSRLFKTLPDALAYFRENGLGGRLRLHALGGDKLFEGQRLSALVEILPEPRI